MSKTIITVIHTVKKTLKRISGSGLKTEMFEFHKQ